MQSQQCQLLTVLDCVRQVHQSQEVVDQMKRPRSERRAHTISKDVGQGKRGACKLGITYRQQLAW
jgi:hypothetical protein